MEFFVVFNSPPTVNKMKQLYKNHNIRTLYIYSTFNSLNNAN